VRADGLVDHRERVSGQGVLGGDCGEQDRVAGSRPQRCRSAAGIGTQDRGGRVTRPDGSRWMTTTPASAVRVSRSPPRQPSAPMTVRSATRPERSTWASPYTTSRGSAGGRTGGTVSGKVRAAAGARAGRAAARRGDDRGDQRAGHGCLPRQEAGPVSAVGRPQASAGPCACSSGALKRVMYHHSGCPRGDLNTETR
jgi:hypothetical protein